MKLNFSKELDLEFINTQRSIYTFDFANYFFNELVHNANNSDSLDGLFSNMLEILKKASFHDCYLTDCWDSFCYEITLNIYDTLRIYDYLTMSPVTLSTCVNTYLQQSNRDNLVNDLLHELTNISKELLLSSDNNDNNQLSSLLNRFNIGKSSSYSFFYNFWNHSLSHCGYNFNPLVNQKDLYLLLKFYSNSIYANKNHDQGIQTHKIYNMLSEYLTYYNQSKHYIPEDEHRIYQFEYLYHPLQFSNCICSFLNESFAKEKVPTAYAPLAFYTKLFDTRFISFSDYLLNKFSDDLESFYSDSKKQLEIELTFYEYAVYYLPIIVSCTRYFLLYSRENYDDLKKMCEKFIISAINKNPKISYAFHLENKKNKLENTYYPTKKPQNISTSIKTGLSGYTFNNAISHAYFDSPIFTNCNFLHKRTSVFAGPIPSSINILCNYFVDNFYILSDIYSPYSYEDWLNKIHTDKLHCLK